MDYWRWRYRERVLQLPWNFTVVVAVGDEGKQGDKDIQDDIVERINDTVAK